MASTPQDFTSGQVLTDTAMDKLPQGIVGMATPVTSNVGPTSGTTELDVITAPAVTPLQTNRRLRIVFTWRSFSGTVTADIFTFRIKEGSTVLNESNEYVDVLSVGINGGSVTAYVDSPTAASHTYKGTIVRSAGTGTATIQASSTFPITLAVEDAGQA